MRKCATTNVQPQTAVTSTSSVWISRTAPKFIRCAALQPPRHVGSGETWVVGAEGVRVRAARERKVVSKELQG
jgi:hypothetical protein